MARYGYGVYGTSKYGAIPNMAYSVEPMSVTVLTFDHVYLTWQSPTGNFTRFRVVRNQGSYPETAEDGVIIYEVTSPDGSSLEGVSFASSFTDGLDNPEDIPLVQGTNVFYRVFLYNADNVWVKAGQITDVIPKDTGVTSRSINLLPRVVTTPELSPLGVVDESSTLYKFLDGISFEYEQLLTQLDLARPTRHITNSNYTTIPGETLHVGLNPEPNLPPLRQRALIREALGLYSKKGTALGVAGYAESLTGFAPTVTVSPNLLLSPQDSTFYGSVGNWVSTVDTIAAVTDTPTSTLSTSYVIDSEYSCKITATGVHQMTLGLEDPVRLGIPVLPEVEYAFYCEAKAASTNALAAKVEYYDKDGNVLGDDSGTLSATTSWQKFTFVTTSPALASYAVLYFNWSATTTFYVDRVQFSVSSVTEFHEARAATIELAPAKENYITNPSFELGLDGWTETGATLTQDTAIPVEGYPGSHSAKVVASGAWSLQCEDAIPVEVGIYLTVSQYLKSSTITSVNAIIELYDADDVLLETSTATLNVSSSWTRTYSNTVIADDSTAAYAKYRLEGTAGTLYLDMVMAQDAFRPTDYFDGSMPAQTGVLWKGTAGASTSLLYPTKEVKFRRLAETLNDWVPMNLWWRLTTPAGLEYTNLDV